jgi:hypothetical protein
MNNLQSKYFLQHNKIYELPDGMRVRASEVDDDVSWQFATEKELLPVYYAVSDKLYKLVPDVEPGAYHVAECNFTLNDLRLVE